MVQSRISLCFRVLLLALAPVMVGCAGSSTALAPSATMTTAIQGWEHYFRLDWAARATPAGGEVDGYIYNNYGASAYNVQILAQALDPAGNLVNQKLTWVNGSVPGFNRAFFRVAGLAPADRYRLSVWAFDFVQSPSSPIP